MQRSKHVRFFEVGVLVPYVALACLGFVAIPLVFTFVPPAHRTEGLVAVVVVGSLSTTTFRLQRFRARRILRAHKFRICARCRYTLDGLPDEGVCPECGENYELTELRRMWQDRYSLY